MKESSATLNTWNPSRHRGAALVLVLIIVTVLSVVAANLLLTTTARYHTTFQGASWQEAIVGSEAGVDLAMNELRKRVVMGPSASFQTNWTTLNSSGTQYANYGHAFPANNQPYVLSTHAGEGASTMQARVYLDVPGSGATPSTNFAVPPSSASYISLADNPALRDPDGVDRSRWWYRIRSLGVAGLSGPPIANLQKLDNQLRRFSFFNDWRTGRPVTTPQVARMVEVIVKPETNFRNALMADKQINLSDQDVLVDSYDSSKGLYSNPGNVGQMGNIATNGQLINANHATVNGDAMTNNGTVAAGDKVTGQQSNNFYQELTPVTPNMLNPAWAGVSDGGTLTSDATYTASTDPLNPTLVHLDGINLPDGKHVINFAAPGTPPPPGTAPTPSFVKVYVQGDIITTGTSYINLGTGVNAIVYVTGNVNVQGTGIINNTYLGSHLVLNGVQPPANSDGSFPARSINIATNVDFEGVVYAPNHDLTLALTVVPASGIPGLQAQAVNLNGQLAALQADYQQAQAIYQKTGAPGQYKKMQNDLAQIAIVQAQIAQVNTQVATATSVPSSSLWDHIAGYNGIYGGFVARTITVANKTHVHYDETLRTAGPVNHYEIVSWFEDNISRDAGGGNEVFWWP